MGCYLRKTSFAGILNSTMRNNSGPMGAEPGKVINYEFFVNLLRPLFGFISSSENSALKSSPKAILSKSKGFLHTGKESKVHNRGIYSRISGQCLKQHESENI